MLLNAQHQYWGSRLTTPKGRELYKTIKEKKIEILSTGETTYWPTDVNKTPDLIDFFIFKGLSHNYLDIKPNLDSIGSHANTRNSDYKHTHFNSQTTKNAYQKCKLRCNQKPNRRKLTTKRPAKTAQEIEEAIEKFNNVIQNAAWSATPEEKPQTKYPELMGNKATN
jgi:CMP-N-acetylneuraminic acid synthetase